MGLRRVSGISGKSEARGRLREPRTRHQGVLPHHPHPQPFIFYALAALLCARTRSEKLPSDFIEKLPASVTKIARDAFNGTPLDHLCFVRHIQLEGVIKHEQYTLDDEGKLVFKEGVDTIKQVEKEDQKEIKEVVINEGAKVIGEQAFSDCDELTAVSVPSTVVEIGSWAFRR